MSALVANVLKLAFVGMLYLFLWQMARSIGTHLGADVDTSRKPRRRTGQLTIVRSDGQAGTRVTVSDSVVLGRSPDADVLLEDPYASMFHLRLTMDGDTMSLADLGTTNGTYVNGRRVTGPITLNPGDSVQVGKTIMEVK
ncbi:MAG: FHA domain-containing protein [Acidimicrobiia bacterium]|nr:FHA domain-containing protein [Acidimicrobiia bacterium]